MRRVTSSSLQRVMVCAASSALPAVTEQVGQAAEDGTAIHRYLYKCLSAPWQAMEDVPADLVGRVKAMDFGALSPYWVSPGVKGELAMVYNAFSGKVTVLGENIDRKYPDENPGDIFLTCDLCGPDLVLDYKTGRHRQAPALENWQLRLGAVAMRSLHGSSKVEMGLAYLQDDGSWDFDTVTVGAMELDDWSDQLHGAWGRISEARDAIRRGISPDVHPTDDGCRYCPCVTSCPAYSKLAKSLLGGLVNLEEIHLTPSMAGEAWILLTRCEKVLDKVRSGLVAMASQTPIPLRDGKVLQIVQEPREYLDAEVAERVIRESFGEDLAEACTKRTVNKSSMRALGNKMDTALNLIRRAGGARMTYHSTAKEVRVKK